MAATIPPEVDIRAYAAVDLGLLERLLGDPAMTVRIGGAESPEAIVARHERHVGSAGLREGPFAIVAGLDGAPAMGRLLGVVLARRGRGGVRMARTAPVRGARRCRCRRLGFECPGEVEVECPKGSMMRSNDWRLDLDRDAGGGGHVG